MGKKDDPLAEGLQGLSFAELQEFGRRVIDLAAFDRARPVSRRRRRSGKAFTVSVRIDLDGAKPPIWRRVELPSTLTLDQVHDLAQALFGWTDSHLHRFALGASVWDRDAELFLCPYDVEEGENEGVPESTVRLDEALAEAGDRLRYVYDYGDDWALTFEVEGVSPTPCDQPRVLAARGIAPPDDCGGIYAWNDERDDQPVELSVLQQAVDGAVDEWALPLPVRQVLRRLEGHPSYMRLCELVEGAVVAHDAEAAAEALLPYRWLLGRVGGGIALTQAGYLPPKDVVAAMTELKLDEHWIGKGNREDLTQPVADLRRSAQRLGLLRVSKGRLLPTKAGTAAFTDPDLLVSTVVQKAGALGRTAVQRELTTLVLLVVAAGRSIEDETYRRLVAQALGDLGWSRSDGGRIEPWGLMWVDENTQALLGVLGCLGWRRAEPPPAGAREVAGLVLGALV